MSLPTVSVSYLTLWAPLEEGTIWLGKDPVPEPGTPKLAWSTYMEISRATYYLCMGMFGEEGCGCTLDLRQIESILSMPSSEWQGSKGTRVMSGFTSTQTIREELEAIRVLIVLRGQVLLSH
jgi:hypothetical protein